MVKFPKEDYQWKLKAEFKRGVSHKGASIRV